MSNGSHGIGRKTAIEHKGYEVMENHNRLYPAGSLQIKVDRRIFYVFK